MTTGARPPVEQLHRDRAAVSALCGLSLVLGFVTVGDKSLWSDEAYSATVASGSWQSLYESWRVRDANMSLYHVVLHVWRDLASSDAFLRSLSVIATAASVAVVFAIGRRLFDAGTGMLAAVVLAVAPFGVEYGQQIRSYALTMLLVSLSTYCFVVAVETDRRAAWAGYVVCSVLAVYAHFFAALVLVAHAASVPFLPREHRRVRPLAISAASILMLLVPGVLLAASGPSDQLDWLPRPGLKTAFGQPTHLAGGPLLALAFFALLVAAGAAGWHIWRAHGPSPESWHVSVVFAWLLVPYLLSLAYSVLVAPAYLDRFLLVSLPALSLAVAVGLRRLRRSWAVATTVVIVVASLIAVVDWYREPSRQEWRGAVEYVLDRSKASDGVVVCGDRRSFEYYVLQHDRSNAPTPLRPSDPWQVGFHSLSDDGSRPLPPRVWLVSEGNDADRRRCARRSSLAQQSRTASASLSGVRVDAYDE
jgi:mannosyltransferase